MRNLMEIISYFSVEVIIMTESAHLTQLYNVYRKQLQGLTKSAQH